jgi:hypothetical protein
VWGPRGSRPCSTPPSSRYYDHGIEVGFSGNTDYTDVVRTLNLAEGLEEEVVSTDPLRVRVTFSHDGDELHLLLDDGMNVLEVDQNQRRES